MYLRKITYSIVTATSKGDIETSTSWVRGFVRGVTYTKSTSGALSATADLSIATTGGTNILTSLVVGSASFNKCPALTVVNTTNGAIANESWPIPIVNERIAVTVSAASKAAQTGTYDIYWEGSD